MTNVYTNHQKTVCFAVYVEESQNILILTLAGASGMGDPYLLWRCGNLGIYHCGNYYSQKITESQDPICNGQKFNRIRQASEADCEYPFE